MLVGRWVIDEFSFIILSPVSDSLFCKFTALIPIWIYITL